MFCKNCGAQIADNATFCPKCGAQVGNADGASRAYVNAGPSIFKTMASWIKSFFSGNAVSVLKEVAADESFTGLVGLLFESFLIASFITLLPLKAVSSAANMAGNYASSMMGGYGSFNFSSFFLCPIGIDRFVRGQFFLGLFKIITGGLGGLWYVVDFLIAFYKAYLGPYAGQKDFQFFFGHWTR